MTKKLNTVLLILALCLTCLCLAVACDGGSRAPVTKTRTVNIYAINDFHGETDRVAQLGGFLMERRLSEDAVLINSGDMFQGSFESNSNKGELLVDCMNVIGFDCLVPGNHEYNWGIDTLRHLSEKSTVPFLNAYLFRKNNDGSFGDYALGIVRPYTVKVLDNGLKVGIVGISDKFAHISTEYGLNCDTAILVQTVQMLRDIGCDVVLLASHADSSVYLEDENFDVTQYVDAVFCGHVHQNKIVVKNGVPFIQANAFAETISHVQLSVVPNGEVSLVVSENIPFNNAWQPDRNLQDLVAAYTAPIREEGSKIVTTFGDDFPRRSALTTLLAKSLAELALEKGYDIALSAVSIANRDIGAGPVSFSDLTKAFPSGRRVFVVQVKGKDILELAEQDKIYIWRTTSKAIKKQQYYLVAVAENLLYAPDGEAKNKYFPSAFKTDFEFVLLSDSDAVRCDVDVVCNYLLKREVVWLADVEDAIRTDKNLLGEKVTFGG